MSHYRVVLHHNGPALWPEHKPIGEVLWLQKTTPELVWSATYQGRPAIAGGHSFKREWWQGENRRFDLGVGRHVVARYVSADTAYKAGEDNDYFAHTVGELLADSRLAITYVKRKKLEFPELVDELERIAIGENGDGLLRGVIIEDKASGTSALQTLGRAGPEWLQPLLIPCLPTTDKETRYDQAGVWCKNGSVILPYKSAELTWLAEFEDELFSVPQSAHDDMADSFAQLVLYLELLLEDGLRTRQ